MLFKAAVIFFLVYLALEDASAMWRLVRKKFDWQDRSSAMSILILNSIAWFLTLGLILWGGGGFLPAGLHIYCWLGIGVFLLSFLFSLLDYRQKEDLKQQQEMLEAGQLQPPSISLKTRGREL